MTVEMQTVRLRITGKVQGVGYRIWATRVAVGLELHGWVRNRVDGSVEMLVTGTPQNIAAMIEASRVGPPGARVSDVTVTPDQHDESREFVALPTE
jgi:acylphosphatase